MELQADRPRRWRRSRKHTPVACTNIVPETSGSVDGRRFLFVTHYQGVTTTENICQSCERMARAEQDIESLQRGADLMDKKLDRLQYWIMTQTAGIAAALLILLWQIGK